MPESVFSTLKRIIGPSHSFKSDSESETGSRLCGAAEEFGQIKLLHLPMGFR
jgi:hypothetical protein